MNTGVPNINGHQQQKLMQAGAKKIVSPHSARKGRHVSQENLPPTTKLPSITNKGATIATTSLGAMRVPVNAPTAPVLVPEEKLQALRDWLSTASDTDKLEVFENICSLLINVSIGSGDCFLSARDCYEDGKAFCPVLCIPIFDELMSLSSEKPKSLRDPDQGSFFKRADVRATCLLQIPQMLIELSVYPHSDEFKERLLSVAPRCLRPIALEKYVLTPLRQGASYEK